MATNRVGLQNAAWTNLGSGPMFLQNRGPKWPVYWCLSASDPGVGYVGDISDQPQNELGGGGAVADVNIGFAQTVWARGQGHVVVTN